MWAVLVQADCFDSLWVALPWSDLLGLTPARKERREGDTVVRRAHAAPADFEGTAESLNSVNRVLCAELLVKYAKKTVLIKTEIR